MNRKHGMNGTKVYRAWQDMRSRCHNVMHAEYHNYGGRGIRVCERWDTSFAAFLADIGLPPSKSHSLERRNVNGHYEPSNCTWATKEEQDNNRRATRRLAAFGETKSVALWARDSRCCVNINTLRARLRRGMPPELAIGSERIPLSEAGRRGGHAGLGVSHARS